MLSNDYSLTTHHLYWPRKHPAYMTDIGRTFRELPEDKVQIAGWSHEFLHRFARPPNPPSESAMIAFIERSVESHKHRRLVEEWHDQQKQKKRAS